MANWLVISSPLAVTVTDVKHDTISNAPLLIFLFDALVICHKIRNVVCKGREEELYATLTLQKQDQGPLLSGWTAHILGEVGQGFLP